MYVHNKLKRKLNILSILSFIVIISNSFHAHAGRDLDSSEKNEKKGTVRNRPLETGLEENVPYKRGEKKKMTGQRANQPKPGWMVGKPLGTAGKYFQMHPELLGNIAPINKSLIIKKDLNEVPEYTNYQLDF